MTYIVTQQEQQQTSVGGEAGAPAWPRLVVITAALLIGCAAEYFIGMDAVWPMITGGIVTAGLAFAADVAIARGQAKLGGLTRVVQTAAVVMIAAGVALFYASERRGAFETVFGMPPVSGISHVDVRRLKGSDNGWKILILEFQCDAATMERLVERRKFSRRAIDLKDGREAKAQRGVWSGAFNTYGLSVVDRWKNRLPVLEPVVYHWTGKEKGTLGRQASVLWDAASGRGCAVHASSS